MFVEPPELADIVAGSQYSRSQKPPHIQKSKGAYVIAWIETNCVYTIGRWAGKPVKLLPWQKAWIMALFAVDPETGRRWYRWALLGMPKKNGKSEVAAWLSLYFLVGDGEPTPYVGIGASADHQANLVFSAAARCAEWSPTLSRICKVYEKEITAPSIPGGKIIRVASSGATNDGPSWSALILDELHEWSGDKGRKLWTVLTNGIGGREQPLIIQITTAGFDKETVCGEQYSLGKLTADDWEADPRFFFQWYEPDDPDCDYKDPAIWKSISPSWGVAIPDPVVYLKDQSVKKLEAEFRRYFLNQWTDAEEMWLPWGAWDACEDAGEELDPRKPLFVGIDGALKRDTFAIVAYQRQDLTPGSEEVIRAVAEELEILLPEQLTRDVVRAWIWQNPYPKGHARFSEWKFNLFEPKQKMRELREEYPEAAMLDDDDWPIPGPAFLYDPYALALMATELEDEGLNMIEVPQTDQRMCPASEMAYERILTRVLSHDGDPRLKRQVQSAVPKMKDRGWRITRPTGSRKAIDAASGLVMAVYGAYSGSAADDGEPNIW
jgi:phage terminase large subunit-like protein